MPGHELPRQRLPVQKLAQKLQRLSNGSAEEKKKESNTKMEKAYELDKKYMTQQEVAERFRVSPSTIKNWRDQGKLDYFQPDWSTRVLYPADSIEEFERQHTKKAKVIEFKKPAEIQRTKPEVSPRPKKEWRI
jgi:DNA-binding transcriptional regulator YiaG